MFVRMASASLNVVTDGPCYGPASPVFGACENEGMPRKEVYCENCRSSQPMIEHEPQKDELNPYPWYDITCGTCYSVIATVQIVPDDKPLEPSAAVADQPAR